MNLIQQLLQGGQQAPQKQAATRSEVPASLLAMLSQQHPHENIASIMQALGGQQLPSSQIQMQPLPEPDTRLATAQYTADAKAQEEELKRQQALQEAAAIKELAPQLYGALEGQNLDPLQQAFVKQQKVFMSSGIPALQKLAVDMSKDFQTGATGILSNQISPTATMKDVMSMNLQPGTTEFNNVMRGTLLKPSTQINMGNEYMSPATPEEKKAWGIPANMAAVKNHKTGEVAARPVNVTEDQGKSSMNLGELTTGVNSMREILKSKTMDPAASKQDYIGSTLVDTGIPVLRDLGKALESGNQQEFDQAKAQIHTGIVHLLSGQGFTGAEIETKAKAYTPTWGEGPEAITKKLEALDNMMKTGARRAGVLGNEEPTSAPSYTDSKALPDGRTAYKINGKWMVE